MYELNVNIKNENGNLLVSSRDIAKGLEKEHKDVLRKIREVLNEREFSLVKYKDEKGEIRPEYLLGKNAFILLVMNYTGYNDFKRAYIERFDEMERQLNLGAPQNFPEALRRLADEVEQKELMREQRDEAIRTKAWIGSKREATAMNTASQKAKEVKKLQAELGLRKTHASIKCVEKLTKQKYDWRKLKDYCVKHDLKWDKVGDVNYGSVNVYPAEAWMNVYGVDLAELVNKMECVGNEKT